MATAEPVAGGARELIDVPLSDLHVTDQGRKVLTGEITLVAQPGFDPGLALDLLLAVAYAEYCHAATGRSW
jgi:hypothetical protein